ncbi:hypothetical protein [Amycolatopsis jejuensis]|uniref:hypothetical protein n=1 Tax=Amycolatopsis jejuensis TaxID=330084 RepID=UPI000524AEBE|nr:hypothetical protein [Amycolatopsis jejuensis]
MTTTGTARQSGVTAEVAPGGALRHLELTAAALRTGGPRLADTILRTVREATAQANERARHLLEAELGPLGDELPRLGLSREDSTAAHAEDTTPTMWSR